MTVTIYPNGTGGVLGDELVTETELYMTGVIYFVHHSGDDTNSGLSRQKPFASLAFAVTVLAENDVIVMLDGHTETIAAALTIGFAGVKIVGEGTASGVPTVTLTSGTDQTMLTLDDVNITLGNIKFAPRTATSAFPRVQANGARSTLRGCHLECGEFDTYTVNCDADATGTRFYNTTFVVTSTAVQPGIGITFSGAANLEMEACAFDGGSVGFSAGGFFDGSALGGPPPANLRCQQLRLLNGAQFITGDDTTGYVGISERTGSAMVQGFDKRLAKGFMQTGDAMLADTEFYMSGDIFYVHYGTGDDANSGLDELAPKKTVASALSVLSNDCSIVVLLPSHVEPLTASFSPPLEGTTIIGCGTSGGRPTCRFYNSDTASNLYAAALISSIRNIWFDKTTSEDPTTALVAFNSQYVEMRGCLVTPGDGEQGATGTDSFQTYRESKFESAGISIADRPSRGLSFSGEATLEDIDIRGCEFSNSQYGFTQASFYDGADMLRLYVISMTQSFGADVNILDSTTGIVNPETSSGSALVEW